jgi:hypothetical protein
MRQLCLLRTAEPEPRTNRVWIEVRARKRKRVKNLHSHVSYSMTPSVQIERKPARSTQDDPDAQPQAERLRSWQMYSFFGGRIPLRGLEEIDAGNTRIFPQVYFE